MNNTFSDVNNELDMIITQTLQANSIDPNTFPLENEKLEEYDLSIMKVVSNILPYAKSISIEKEQELSSAFHKRHLELWNFPFSLSDTFVEFAFYLVRAIQVPADKEHITEFVLSKLIGKALRTYSEVIVLLKQGFPYGAFALSRQIFELAVFISFIRKYGDTVALDFYNESSADLYKHKENYEWARKSGCFGDKGHITFNGIERESGIHHSVDDDKRIFSFLSKFIHASPQTIFREPTMELHEIGVGPSSHSIDKAHYFSANYFGISLLHINNLLPSIALQKRLIFCINWIRRMNEEYKKVSDSIAKPD